MTDLPKHQHYVPQLLLRNFAFGKKPQVHVLDKRDARSFVGPINKTGAKRGYYNVPRNLVQKALEAARQDGADVLGFDHLELSLEPALGTLETRAADVIRRIVETASLAGLTRDDRVILAYFATVQFLRVPHIRNAYRQMVDVLRERVGGLIEKKGKDVAAGLASAGLGPLTPDAEAQMHISHLIEAPTYLPYFLNKDWFLQRAPAGHPLYIGDNPVTLWNWGPRNDSPVRAFGLGTLKSEIALPLSPRLCLTMICPSILEESRRTLTTVEKLHAGGAQGVREETARVRHFVDAAESGKALAIDPENVEHLNGRQVHMATRYIYSSDPRFTLARKLLKENPEMRDGPRVMG